MKKANLGIAISITILTLEIESINHNVPNEMGACFLMKVRFVSTFSGTCRTNEVYK